jgi:hypothetical protein
LRRPISTPPFRSGPDERRDKVALSPAAPNAYLHGMSDLTSPDLPSQDLPAAPAQASSAARWLLAGTAATFLGAGALLWVREGERLFTDGLIAAIARCF